jgi:hypothetical protein
MRSRLFPPLLAVLATLAIAPAAALAAVPQGFVGTNIDGPFFYPQMDQSGQMSQMVASGVESARVLVNWGAMQPYSSFQSMPPSPPGTFQNIGGVPTNFALMDDVVGLAATHGLTVLPQIEYAPPWDSGNPSNKASPPKSAAPYARFVQALVQRYGPRGTFWAANPGVPRIPVRMWQIWNEPDFTSYWSQQPFEKGYMNLVRAAHAAIKSADPGAKVILAGLPNLSWIYLQKIYAIRGARGLFDAVAVHPYTATPSGAITIIRRVRAVMDRAGDRGKPIFATELSWPSASGKARTLFENATTESGQATKVPQAMRLLAKYRKTLRIGGFYYYTWMTNETMPGASGDPFNFAGLLRFINGVGITPKPVYATFTSAALAIEGCRSKSGVATNCVR